MSGLILDYPPHNDEKEDHGTTVNLHRGTPRCDEQKHPHPLSQISQDTPMSRTCLRERQTLGSGSTCMREFPCRFIDSAPLKPPLSKSATIQGLHQRGY